jgi:hypothetical protein
MRGDLIVDPVRASVKKVMLPVTVISKVTEGDLFNPMMALYKKGIGTLGYRSAWNLFDQMIMTSALIDNSNEFKTLSYYNAKIFNKDFLINDEGNFKGYPYRTYGGPNYLGGYSDHFPVYLFLVRAK